jgi:hypothetical protein
MADDCHELIRKFDLLTRFQPLSSLRSRSVMAEGRIPDRAQQHRDWLFQYCDDPTVPDEATQARINNLKREIRKLERAIPLMRFVPPLINPPLPTVGPSRFRRVSMTTVEPQQTDAIESSPSGGSGEAAHASESARRRRKPSVTQRMTIDILRDKLGDRFSADNPSGRAKIVADGWKAESNAPLGDPSLRGAYTVPHPKTIGRTIEDYLSRPDAYPKRRR